MRQTIHISLPESLKQWLDREVHRRGYGSANAFVRHLILQEQTRIGERRRRGASPDEDDLLLPPPGIYPTRRPGS